MCPRRRRAKATYALASLAYVHAGKTQKGKLGCIREMNGCV